MKTRTKTYTIIPEYIAISEALEPFGYKFNFKESKKNGGDDTYTNKEYGIIIKRVRI